MINPWNEISQPSREITARRISAEHPLDLFWARDHQGNYLFIYEFLSETTTPKVDFPNLVGITVVLANENITQEKKQLILLLNDKEDWEIFLSLCNDLVQATNDAKNQSPPVQIILRRLEYWQEFLKNKGNNLLGEEKILGLIGELIFINHYLIPAFGVGQSIRFWHGPEGAPQDFNVNENAIEVKCKLGTTSPKVKISSVDQLCSQLPSMHLFVVILGDALINDPDLINLPSLVSLIRNKLKLDAPDQIERFNNHLHRVGYFESDYYLAFNYVLADQKMYLVKDGFPRICSKDLHSAITNLTYSINLSECAQFENYPEWMRIA